MGNCINNSITPSNENQISQTPLQVKSTTQHPRSTLRSSLHQPFDCPSVKSFCLNHSIPDLTSENPSFNPQTASPTPFPIPTPSDSPPITIQGKASSHYLLKQINFHSDSTMSTFNSLIIEAHFAFEFMLLPFGFIEHQESIYLIYPKLSLTLADLIAKDSLDLRNKLVTIKNLITALRTLHENDLGIEALMLRGICFTKKRLSLKLSGFMDNCDNDKERKADDIYLLGLIALCLFVNCGNEGNDWEEIGEMIKRIENVYHKAFVVGLIRKEREDRPSIDEVLKVFNQMIERNDMGLFTQEEIKSLISGG